MTEAKTPEELDEAHWKYIESLRLKALEMEKKMYIDAFIHGHKHGKEDKELEG